MTGNSSEAAGSARRSWLLMISLALNLLIAGAVASAMLLHPRHGPPWGGRGAQFYDPLNFGRALGGPFGFRAFSANLPPDRRAALKPLIDRARETIKPLRQEHQRARDLAVAAATSEPFDAVAVEKSVGEMIEADGKLRRGLAHVFTDVMTQLSPQERVQFIAWRKSHEPPPPPPAEAAAPGTPPASPK